MAQRSKVSLVDVAKEAGVSIATVSRALNESDLAPEGTRAKVRKVAEKLGYMPDPRFRIAAQNRGGKPHRGGSIGLMFHSRDQSHLVADPYYGRLFWSVEQTARELGRHILLTAVEVEREPYLLDVVADMKVDGVLVIDTHLDDLIGRIQTSVPVVQVNSFPGEANTTALIPDNAGGIAKILNYLLALGHRRIWYFDIHDFGRNADGKVLLNYHHLERAKAFRQYCQEMLLDQARAIILTERAKPLEEVCRDYLRIWSADDSGPSAIICGADVYALAFLKAAEDLGIRVPGQLSVVGIDDSLLSAHSRPTLTTIRPPLEAMGAAAVRILVDQINGAPSVKSIQRFDVELVLRQSCAKPANL